MHLMAAALMTPSGVPPIPHRKSTGRSSVTASSEPATSPSVISRTRPPAARMAAMPVRVARAVEHDGHDVAHVRALALGHALHDLAERPVEVEQVGELLARRHLLHVDERAGIEHRPALGQGDHRDGVRAALRAQARALQRVDRDVDRGRRAVADRLAVGEHGRLVLLALADHDDAVHVDALQHGVHAVHRPLVGRLLVPHADPRRAAQRGGLRDPHELEGEVAVRDECLGASGLRAHGGASL